MYIYTQKEKQLHRTLINYSFSWQHHAHHTSKSQRIHEITEIKRQRRTRRANSQIAGAVSDCRTFKVAMPADNKK